MLGKGIYDDQGHYSDNLIPNKGGLTLFSSRGGTFTANGVTPVDVVDPRITANSVVIFFIKTVGGTPAAITPLSSTPGTGFRITSVALNTSVYNYIILERA